MMVSIIECFIDDVNYCDKRQTKGCTADKILAVTALLSSLGFTLFPYVLSAFPELISGNKHRHVFDLLFLIRKKELAHHILQ